MKNYEITSQFLDIFLNYLKMSTYKMFENN